MSKKKNSQTKTSKENIAKPDKVAMIEELTSIYEKHQSILIALIDLVSKENDYLKAIIKLIEQEGNICRLNRTQTPPTPPEGEACEVAVTSKI